MTSEMSRRVSIVDGSPVRAGPAYGWAEEFSILRGKLVIGVLRAYPAGRGPLAVEHREGLHAVAAVVGLALDAAHARELATHRAATGARYRSPWRRWAQY